MKSQTIHITFIMDAQILDGHNFFHGLSFLCMACACRSFKIISLLYYFITHVSFSEFLKLVYFLFYPCPGEVVDTKVKQNGHITMETKPTKTVNAHLVKNRNDLFRQKSGETCHD